MVQANPANSIRTITGYMESSNKKKNEKGRRTTPRGALKRCLRRIPVLPRGPSEDVAKRSKGFYRCVRKRIIPEVLVRESLWNVSAAVNEGELR